MSVWLVKCSDYAKGGSGGWHWNDYLDNERGVWSRDETWGGPEWIRSTSSMKRIREEIAKGDLVVCYQVEERAILGLTQMAACGTDDPPGSGDYNTITLVSASKALKLNRPLTVFELRDTGCDPKSFGPGSLGTVFPLSDSEFKGIIAAIKAYSPKMMTKLDRWLKHARHVS
jgi:hypothetical protein